MPTAEIVGTYLRFAPTDERVSCSQCGTGVWVSARRDPDALVVCLVHSETRP